MNSHQAEYERGMKKLALGFSAGAITAFFGGVIFSQNWYFGAFLGCSGVVLFWAAFDCLKQGRCSSLRFMLRRQEILNDIEEMRKRFL